MIFIIFLLIAAFGLLFDQPLLTVLGALGSFVTAWLLLAFRFPLVAVFVIGFVRGLTGRRW